MKPTPSPFQSLLWLPVWIVVAVLMLWLGWLLLMILGERGWFVAAPAFLMFCAWLIRYFTRQLDKVEGPFPRPDADNEDDV